MDNIDGEAAGALSGYSVSLSLNGSKVAIVAYHNNANSSNSGYTCIYKISGGTQLQIGNDIDGAWCSLWFSCIPIIRWIKRCHWGFLI